MNVKVQRSFGQGAEFGSLFLVATPIGNLEDLTFRAVRTLKEVDWIAAEDTRRTRKLLTHYEIATHMVSYHEHNKMKSGPQLIGRLMAGENVALVSDAGMPAISDPGFDLVHSAIGEGIAVIPIPGANAAISALVVSGLPTENFTFIGFLPRSAANQRKALEQHKSLAGVVILYESPHRLIGTLSNMLDIWGNRQLALARELTKKYEEVIRGTIGDCLDWLQQHPPLGEYCLVVEGMNFNFNDVKEHTWWAELSETMHVQHYIKTGVTHKEAIRKAAVDRKLPKRELYARLVEAKKGSPDVREPTEEI